MSCERRHTRCATRSSIIVVSIMGTLKQSLIACTGHVDGIPGCMDNCRYGPSLGKKLEVNLSNLDLSNSMTESIYLGT